MRRPASASAAFGLALALAIGPATAMVGGAPPGGDAEGRRHAVLMVIEGGGFCTGVALAADLLVTAAHCVPPGRQVKIVEFTGGAPRLRDIGALERHPEYSERAWGERRVTPDLALVRVPGGLPAGVVPAGLAAAREARAGDRFLVAGFGTSVEGDGRSGGVYRAATLEATGRPSRFQVRLFDPETRGQRPGRGACRGGSGGPVFEATGERLALAGIVSWTTGVGRTSCGALTGALPLASYRAWIADTARRLGSPIE